ERGGGGARPAAVDGVSGRRASEQQPASALDGPEPRLPFDLGRRAVGRRRRGARRGGGGWVVPAVQGPGARRPGGALPKSSPSRAAGNACPFNRGALRLPSCRLVRSTVS